MSTNQQKNNNEEEVDLGSLFVIIGKGFTKFFNFIGSIFKGIFHGFISILIFLKSNVIAIAIATIIGAVAGFFLEKDSVDLFESEMLVKPNFGSTKLLYKNIDFYNDLVKQKDTASLVETFQLTRAEAGSLKGFKIENLPSEHDIVDAYDKFAISNDTTTIKSFEYENFKATFSELDYKIHRIIAKSTQNNIFIKLQPAIIDAVKNNTYFKLSRNVVYKSLVTSDTILKRSIAQIDSLQSSYVKATLKEANKSTSGTNIDLGSSSSRPKEVELFETNRRLIEDLQDIVEDKVEKSEVVHVVSGFKPIGYKVSGITKNFIFLLGVLGAVLVIITLLLIKLNSYLNNYKK
jgi:hypothetical protein